MATLAVAMAPQNDHHRSLAAWIRAGAHTEKPSVPLVQALSGTAGEASLRPVARVAALLQREMKKAGFEGSEIEAALDIWDDYWLSSVPSGVGKPEVYAAAITYSVVRIRQNRGFTQGQIADWYGVSASALSRRYRHIVNALSLGPRDPRYID